MTREGNTRLPTLLLPINPRAWETIGDELVKILNQRFSGRRKNCTQNVLDVEIQYCGTANERRGGNGDAHFERSDGLGLEFPPER